MPTIFTINGFRFFFYSNENNEPAHGHVKKGNAEGKIWIMPVLEICYFHGFSKSEEKDIVEITKSNFELIKATWNEYFNQ